MLPSHVPFPSASRFLQEELYLEVYLEVYLEGYLEVYLEVYTEFHSEDSLSSFAARIPSIP